MSNFHFRFRTFEPNDWMALGRGCLVVLLCLGIVMTLHAHLRRQSVQMTSSAPPDGSDYRGPSRAVLTLFGESTRAKDFGTPVENVVLEPIGLLGVLWRNAAAESTVLLSFRGVPMRAGLGTTLPDGSSVVDITPSGVLLSRRRHVTNLELALTHGLDFSSDPFSAARRGHIIESASGTLAIDSSMTPTERIDALVRMHASAALQPRPMLPKRPVTPRRPGAQPFSDPRFARLQDESGR